MQKATKHRSVANDNHVAEHCLQYPTPCAINSWQLTSTHLRSHHVADLTRVSQPWFREREDYSSHHSRSVTHDHWLVSLSNLDHIAYSSTTVKVKVDRLFINAPHHKSAEVLHALLGISQCYLHTHANIRKGYEPSFRFPSWFSDLEVIEGWVGLVLLSCSNKTSAQSNYAKAASNPLTRHGGAKPHITFCIFCIFGPQGSPHRNGTFRHFCTARPRDRRRNHRSCVKLDVCARFTPPTFTGRIDIVLKSKKNTVASIRQHKW